MVSPWKGGFLRRLGPASALAALLLNPAGAGVRPSPSPSLAVPAAKASMSSPGSSIFQEEIERDFPLRSRGELQVTNMRGDITVQSWSLDRIRVKAKRRALATSQEDARRFLSAVDVRFSSSSRPMELAAEYGRGLSLEERLKERSNPRTRMDITVYAPPGLRLRVWGIDGSILIKGRGAAVDARSSTGAIRIEGIRAGGVSVLCPSCPIRISEVRGPVRCMGSIGAIQLSGIEATQAYVETSRGEIGAERVRGEQLYVTREGRLSARDLQGRIEFHAGTGAVRILEGSGFLSGRTSSGSVFAEMREWEFADKAVIESDTGDIHLALPRDFSGELELSSRSGKVNTNFQVEADSQGGSSARAEQLMNRVSGRVGNGGELLKIHSERGSIEVLRGT